MTSNTAQPFGSLIQNNTSATIDFSKNSGFKLKNKESDDIKTIFQSAVGDFTERPLQIMIREIAKNILIFTPIGWIIMFYMIGRKYKGKLNYSFANIKDTFVEVMASMGLINND